MTSKRFARKLLAASIVVLCGTFSRTSAAEQNLPVIVYHQIRNTDDGPPDSLEAISFERFKSEMQYLHQQGYVTLSAKEVVDYIRGVLPTHTKLVAIQFDDGWKSSQLVLPILDMYGFKATFWIIPGKGIGWPHMDWNELETIVENPRYEIYSHSMTHPWKVGDTLVDWMEGRTPGKGPDQARWELAASRRMLSEKLHRPVPYFAWPAGHYNDQMVMLAKEAGYTALFTIDNGLNFQGDDPFRIRRTMIHGGCNISVFVQILSDGIYRDCSSSK